MNTLLQVLMKQHVNENVAKNEGFIGIVIFPMHTAILDS